jgi:hypothetical protein
MSIKGMSLSELDDKNSGPIWIINSAASSRFQLTGNIVVNIPQPNGIKSDALLVHQTWLPVDISQRFPRKRILEATEFRAAVVNGLITVVSETDAERLLRQDGAVEETQRLRDHEAHVRAAGAARTIADSNVEITRTDGVTDEEENPVEIFGMDDEPENLAKAAKKGIETNEDGLLPSFLMFVEKIQSENDLAALNAIRARAKFSRREIKYMAKKLTDKPKTLKQLQERIKKYGADKSAKAAAVARA